MNKRQCWIRALLLCVLVSALSWCGVSEVLAREAPLSNAHAFVLSVERPAADRLLLKWHIAPGHYLYRDRFHIEATPNVIDAIDYPQGTLKANTDSDHHEVYAHDIIVPVTLKAQASPVALTISYQGCSKAGYCYAPVTKAFQVPLDGAVTKITPTPGSPAMVITTQAVNPADAASAATSSSLINDQNQVRSLFHLHHHLTVLFMFVILGVLLSFTPCVLPMIPILTSIIIGQQQTTMRRAFVLSLAYVFGMAVMYAFAGLLVAMVGSSLQLWLEQPVVIGFTSGLFVLLALSLFGVYELRLPTAWQNRFTHLANHQRGGTYLGVFAMGAISTLIVSPCVTAPLVGVLMYIAQTGDRLFGMTALFAMGFGMGIPLLLIGVSAGRCLPKSGPWMEAIKKLFGIFMLGMAVWLLARVVSNSALYVMFGALFIIVAFFIGIYLPRLIPWRKCAQGFGMSAALVGAFLMVGGISMPNTLDRYVFATTDRATDAFVVVHDLNGLNQQLAKARSSQRTLLLDFYADWCQSCIAMDRHVFASPAVQRELANYILVRADLSENSVSNHALVDKFKVYAPPTIIFFDSSGREMNSKRIIGEMNAKDFLARIIALNQEPPVSH